jgi:uncharacterized protein YggU (UPF0235/DUF167 family)
MSAVARGKAGKGRAARESTAGESNTGKNTAGKNTAAGSPAGARAAEPGTPSVIPVRVRPGAATIRVGGGYPGRYGLALVVAVNAPAVDGRATEMALRAVAGALGLRPAEVTLRAGRTSRDKLFEVVDAPADLPDRIRALLDA